MRLRLAAVLLLAAGCGARTEGGGRTDGGARVAADSPAATPPALGTGAAEAVAMAGLLEAEAASGGMLGIVATHLPSGRRLALNASERYPMASTFKLAVAVAVLARVDSGRISLDQRVTIAPSDFRLGPQPIADSVGPAGGSATVGQLLRSMMVHSDNLATDRLMRLIGGPAAVTAHLRTRQLSNVRVDRYESEVHWQYAGVADVPPESTWTLRRFDSITSAVPRAEKDSAHAAFYADPRDTAMPGEFSALLAQIARGEGISPASRRLLLDAMEASRTGRQRIRGALPEGTTVADKTGTIGTTVNDVGLVTLPDGSQVAIAIFVKGSTRPTAEVEQAIARAARVAYDFFAAGP